MNIGSRMRIIFLFLYNGSTESGIYKKAFSQVQLLNNMGIDANLLLIGDINKTVVNPPFIIRKPVISGKNDGAIVRIIRSRKIAGIVRDYIRNLGPSDVLYVRYSLLIPYCPINFFRPFRKCKLIFEHNAIPHKEYLQTREFLCLLFEFFFGNFVLFQADGGIGVTNEITKFQRNKLWEGKKPFLTISNGITVDSIPLRSPPEFVPNQNITIICVAHFSSWHGVDRFILGLSGYAGKSSITLHLVGDGAEVPNLERLCIKNGISDRVIFHGFLSGLELDRLFDQSHIAIGEMGIHRKKLSESSTLKSREYCSRGIPYIIESSDPDFPDDFPYIMRIPADESPIDVGRVLMFASRVCQDMDHPEKMRQYAVEHLDWSIKMKQLKVFLEESIVKNGSSPDLGSP